MTLRATAAFAALLLMTAGCSNGNTSSFKPQPMPSPEQAATGFGNWWAGDSTECDVPDAALDAVSAAVHASYTCSRAFTKDEIDRGCRRTGLLSGGDPENHHVVTVKQSPLTKQLSVLTWGASGPCQKGPAIKKDKGTYQVTAQQVKGGWIVTGYRVLTGPGAGASFG